MAASRSQRLVDQRIEAVSQALFALRDALAALSLALKDWQFEVDHERQALVASAVQDLLARLAAQPDAPDQRAGERGADGAGS